MDTEEANLNPTPAEPDSAQTSESVETGKSENRVEKDPSYMRSRRIALKKFTLPEEEPTEAPLPKPEVFRPQTLPQ